MAVEEKELLNDQQLARRAKLDRYKEMNVDPFGHSYKVTHSFQQIRQLCNKKTSGKVISRGFSIY